MANRNGADVLGPQKSFVIEMRARREAAGLSRYKLAERLGCSPQWLGKVENFEKPPSEGLADDLDTFFESGGTFRRLWEQMVEARRAGLIPSGFRPLAEAEKSASQLCIFAPLLVPGILQTPEHARLVFEAEQRREKAEELVQLRMERKAIFERPDPPVVFVLIREAVLRDLPQETKVEQCKYLLTMMEDPGVSIQIIPASAKVFQGSGFQLLSFDDGADAAYVDGAGANGHMLTDPAKVRRLAVLFNRVRSAALSAEESESRICLLMEGT